LSRCLVCFVVQLPAEALDIETGHGFFHGASPQLRYPTTPANSCLGLYRRQRQNLTHYRSFDTCTTCEISSPLRWGNFRWIAAALSPVPNPPVFCEPFVGDLTVRTICSAENTATERKIAADATSLPVEIARPVFGQRIMIVPMLAPTQYERAKLTADAWTF